MHVYLDLTPLQTSSSLRGIGRYLRGLVHGLRSLTHAERRGVQVIGLAANAELTRLSPVADLCAEVAAPVKHPVRGSGRRRDLLLSLSAPRLVAPGGLLHLAEPKGHPWPHSVPVTATSHDLITLALPDLYLPRVPLWSRLVVAKFRLRYARYQRVLAVSAATKRDLCSLLDVPEERVQVVPHGVDHDRFSAVPDRHDAARIAQVLGDSEQPFILYLGAGDARKDLGCLVQAYATSAARSHAKLVLAGWHGPSRDAALGRQIAQLRLEDRVIRAGYVDEELVPALYRRARVHAFVSRYEGFGLPVLEAMACGTPTITSPGSSLDEVAGNAALVVPCGQPEPLRAAIDRLFFDEGVRTELREAGLRRAQSFTWRRCAEQTIDFFKSVEHDPATPLS